MRVMVTPRIGKLTEIADRFADARNIEYETMLPGGALRASCRIPWPLGVPYQRLHGSQLAITEGVDPLWCGFIETIAERQESGVGYLDIEAVGPWQKVARGQTYSQVWPNAGGTPCTASEMLAAALYGGCEHVDIDWGAFGTTGLTLSPITWAAVTPLNMVSDGLRIGDNSTSRWSVVTRPATIPALTGIYSDDLASWASWTPVTGGTGGTASASVAFYSRGLGCGQLVNNANGYIVEVYPLAAGYTTICASVWVYLPTTHPAVQTELIQFRILGGATQKGVVYITAANILSVFNAATAGVYTAAANTTLGWGAWHEITFQVVCSAAAGSMKMWLDKVLLINQTGINTGAAAIQEIYLGSDTNRASARTLYFDTLYVGVQPPNLGIPIVSGMKSLMRIKKLGMQDFIVSLADIGGYYVAASSLARAANKVSVAYTGGVTAEAAKANSISRYGQLPPSSGNLNLARATTSALAGYYRDRWLNTYAEPPKLLEPFTVTDHVYTAYGGQAAWANMPVSLINAGMGFTIQERSDLRTLIVAHTKFTHGEDGEPDVCEITPTEPPVTLDAAIMQRTQRVWT
jgi:hypothetical protein